jgi:CheY-like chemotaxis protein
MKTIIDKLSNKSLDIVVIEDNPDDVFLIELAIKKANIKSCTSVFNNGEEAISYLAKLIDEKVKLPDLILLDINLPKITGLEVLKKIKSNKSLKSIPTIIFTSSDSPSDMNYSYKNGADLYVRKPNNINDFKEVMEYIKNYGLN